MILVTGGTGLVGMHLLLKLTEEETSVRALFRTYDRLQKVEDFFAFAKAESRFKTIEWLQADITEIPTLTPCFKNITYVYHCAALISFDPYDFHKLVKTNIEGTANVVNLCLSKGIKKLCYLSSIATLSKLPTNPITEENIWDPNEENSVYAISKYGAEMEVWRGTQEGLPAILFNPGIILGEGDYTKGSGVLFDHILKERSFFPKGSSGIIDVKDVVQLMIIGQKSDITKERYILVSQNISYKTLFKKIAQSLSKKMPTRPLSSGLLRILVVLDALRGVFTRKRRLTKIGALSVQEVKEYSADKVKSELGYIPTPIQETLDRIKKHIIVQNL